MRFPRMNFARMRRPKSLLPQLLLACAIAAAPPGLALAQPAGGEPVTRIERGQLVMEGVPEAPETARERLLQYNNVRAAAFADFTADGNVLITTRFGDVAQLHEIAAPLGMRRQLTFYPEPITGASTRPDGSNDLVFVKDRGGDEFFQGFVFDRASGRATAFTEAGTRNEGLVWSRDGKIAYWAVARSGQGQREIVAGDPSRPETRKVVTRGPSGLSVIDVSPDGNRLLLGEYVSVTKSRRMIFDLAVGTSVEIAAAADGSDVSMDGGRFSADGKTVFLVSDEGAEFARLVRIDLATGARTVLSGDLSWDVERFELSRDGRVIAYSVNEGGLSRLKLMDARSGRALPAPDLPQGVLTGLGFDRDGRRLGLSLSTPSSPGDVWVYDLRARKLVRWTESEIGGLAPQRFASPSLITYDSFDGRQIPAFLYTPDRPGRHPVIITIHGGPEGQSRPNFSPSAQYWVNELGAAVLAPNVRGSTGYGKTYVGLDNGFKREDSVKDIGALLDWIARQPNLDPSRVVVYGGSYGGYMVLASLTHFNDRLAGGVDIVGISNFVTFLENTQGYRRDLRRAEYGDERDPAMRAHLERISPLNNATKITRPLFIIQGLNDPRVPVSEAEQMLAKVRSGGGPVWYLMAKDEGHGFAKKTNRDFQREAETMFFAKVFGLTLE
jgi:dipeptidyl aminopeptidase/acylaminoacyl peptidase